MANKKGSKWGAITRSEPWGTDPLAWEDIKSSFPANWTVETAIQKTAAACKRLGLIQTGNENLTDADCVRIRRQEWAKKRKQK